MTGRDWAEWTVGERESTEEDASEDRCGEPKPPPKSSFGISVNTFDEVELEGEFDAMLLEPSNGFDED